MERPDARDLNAAEVGQILAAVGSAERLAALFDVPLKKVEQWGVVGVSKGPIAAALRYFIVANRELAVVPERTCVFCFEPTGDIIRGYQVCQQCSSTPKRASAAIGVEFDVLADKQRLRIHMRSATAFEFAVHAGFRKQTVFDKQDLEIGDGAFDPSVWVETEDDERVYDVLQLPRRRELVLAAAREGVLVLNVDELFFRRKSDLDEKYLASNLVVTLLLLVWSLAYERAG